MATTDTYYRGPERKARSDSIFRVLPDEYYGYAKKWCAFQRWSVEEAANLLCGCVPHREMLLRGDGHKEIDEQVLEAENRIRAALGSQLRVIDTKRYFDKTWIDSREVLNWARRTGIEVPKLLTDAMSEYRSDMAQHGYHTPQTLALDWTIARFWKDADLRSPPTQGEIISALLQEYPDLSPYECQMVEAIARHPATRETEFNRQDPPTFL